jgi:hypothetical protein
MIVAICDDWLSSCRVSRCPHRDEERRPSDLRPSIFFMLNLEHFLGWLETYEYRYIYEQLWRQYGSKSEKYLRVEQFSKLFAPKTIFLVPPLYRYIQTVDRFQISLSTFDVTKKKNVQCSYIMSCYNAPARLHNEHEAGTFMGRKALRSCQEHINQHSFG